MIRKYKRTIAILLIALLVFPANFSNPVKASDDAESDSIYHETFEDGIGLFSQSGGANLEQVSNDDGNALYVSNRSNDYDGADLTFEDLQLEDGYTYSATVTGYIGEDTNVPDGSEIVLSLIDSYTWLNNVSMVAGESFTLQSEFTVDADNDRLRIQSNDGGKDVPYYIDEVIIKQVVGDEDPGEEDFEPYQVAKFDFEESEQGFGPNGTATVERTDEDSYEGDYSLKVSERGGEDWHGAAIELDEDIYNGASYRITGYVKALSDISEPTEFKATVDDIYFQWAAVNIEKVDEWVKFEGTYTNHDNLDSIPVYFESADVNLDFLLDHIIVEMIAPGSDEEDVRPPAKDFEKITFENGELNGFGPRGDNETVTVTDEVNHTEGGKYAVKVEGREQNWNGPALEVTEYINSGQEYFVSAWVKVASESSAELQLSTQVGDGSGAAYNNITSKTVSPDDGWVLLEGTYRYASLGGGYVTIYVEADNLIDFYIDDVNFQQLESEPIEVDLELTPIKDVYQDDFLIGNAVSIPDMEGPRLELLNHHHNLVTAENAMKPGELYNGREFDFSGADQLVERVIEEDLYLHGHVLVWHEQSPNWLWQDENGTPLSEDDALANMKSHIETVMQHFDETAGDQLLSWDVVNEALSGSWDDPEDWESNLRNTGWLRAIGPDYIYEAFKYARHVADDMDREDMVLYYNDYNDHIQGKATTMYHMIKDINERYAEEHPEDERKLISGVGMQGHYDININPEAVRESIERFEKLDIEIGITELDVTTRTENEYVEREINRQAYIYASLFEIFKEHADSITRVTFWGLNDANSWRSDRFPLLFDGTLGAKPAYDAVINPSEFLETYDEEEIEKNHSYAIYGTPVINAEIDDVWDGAPTLNISRFQGAWESGATGSGRLLWDDENLYVLIDVNDAVLDATGEQAHEQDSVEVFVNETGEYAISYQDGIGQYRVNYLNEATFNPGRYSEGFVSATRETNSGYIVEMAIPWKEISPEHGHTIGFELQINDAEDGSRQIATSWNDLTGMGWQDPSVFGEVTLVKTLDEEPEVPVEKEITVGTGELRVIAPSQIVTIEADGKRARIQTPATLPEGTKISAEFLDEVVDPKSDKGKTLTRAGDVLSIDLTYPEGHEDYQGDFELELSYENNFDWVAIFYLNGETWERQGGEMDAEAGIIRLTVPHFSTYGVFEDSVEDVITDLEEYIQELTERVEELEGLEKDVADLEQHVAGLKAKLEALEANDENLSTLVAELLERVKALEEQVADQEDLEDETSTNEDPEEDDESDVSGELSDEEVTEEGSEDESEQEGHALPETATSLYNYMLIGALILLAGAGLFLYNFKRKKA